MAKFLLIYLFLLSPCMSSAQTRKELQSYLANTLSYQTLTYKTSGKNARITIYKVEFNDCTLNYNILKKIGPTVERYTVRIFMPGISKINMTKTKAGYHVLTFSTKGKRIIKEYPDGNLIHEKLQIIPLKSPNTKALQYLEKLSQSCRNK